MNVIGKECLHDCEADLSAAFGQVIAALADGSWIAQRAAKPSVRSCRFTTVFYGRFGPC
jgi:hypothetical protein